MAAPHVAGIAALVVGPAYPPRRGGGYPGRHGPQAQAGRVGQRAPHRRPLRRRDSGRRGCPEKGPQLARGGHPGVGRGSGAAGPGGVRRRERLGGAQAWVFVTALVLGACGFFFLPSLGVPAWLADSPIGTGTLESLAQLLGPAGQGNPLLWSALLPVSTVALLYGARSLRPALAGLAFGVAAGSVAPARTPPTFALVPSTSTGVARVNAFPGPPAWARLCTENRSWATAGRPYGIADRPALP